MRFHPDSSIFFISVLLFILISIASTSAADTARTDTINTIIISGNRVTKTETVKYLSGIAIGMHYDSSVIGKARKRLKETGLFFKVDLFSLRSSDGFRVYIILTEKFYFLPYDIGGELYSYRYGKPKRWARARLGMEYSNFRGKAEVLRTSASIWDWHSLGLGWYKPFLPSPYFFSVAASADQLPDEVFPIDHSILRGNLTFGRKLPLNSRAEISLMPMFRRRIERDTNFVIPDTARIYEAFSLVRWRTDFRNRYFDPSEGWMLALDMRTNALYNGIAPQFFQLFSDLRWYNPGFFASHVVAGRITSILRDNNAGKTHRLQLGGEGSIRGYARSQFGRYFIGNNSFTFSLEYRFPLIHLPELDLYPLSRYSSYFSAISSRVDGALILDYGRVTSRIDELFSPAPNRMESGTGLGAGLRIVIPTFERSVCFDLVWGTNPWAPRGYLTFMKQPAWHFYLDMFF